MNFGHKFKFNNLLKLSFLLIILILASVYFVNFFSKTGKKTRATGQTEKTEKIEIRFNPQSLRGGLNENLSSLKIQGRPLDSQGRSLDTLDSTTSAIAIRGYRFNVSFNKDLVQVEGLTYPTYCSEVPDVASTKEQANNQGVIKVACANTEYRGHIISKDFNDLITIDFKSKSTSGSFNLSIDPNNNDVGFAKINSDGTLSNLPFSQNQQITMPIEVY